MKSYFKKICALLLVFSFIFPLILGRQVKAAETSEWLNDFEYDAVQDYYGNYILLNKFSNLSADTMNIYNTAVVDGVTYDKISFNNLGYEGTAVENIVLHGEFSGSFYGYFNAFQNCLKTIDFGSSVPYSFYVDNFPYLEKISSDKDFWFDYKPVSYWYNENDIMQYGNGNKVFKNAPAGTYIQYNAETTPLWFFRSSPYDSSYKFVEILEVNKANKTIKIRFPDPYGAFEGTPYRTDDGFIFPSKLTFGSEEYKIIYEGNFYDLYNNNHVNSISFEEGAVSSNNIIFSNFKNLDLSNLDTSALTDISYLFSSNNLEYFDFSAINSSNITTAHEPIANCPSLTTINMSNFDTSNFTGVFELSNGIDSIDTIIVNENTNLSNFNYGGIWQNKDDATIKGTFSELFSTNVVPGTYVLIEKDSGNISLTHSDWLYSFEFTYDETEKKVYLESLLHPKSNMVIPSSATINGEEYTTVLNYKTLFLSNHFIYGFAFDSLSFENGVIINVPQLEIGVNFDANIDLSNLFSENEFGVYFTQPYYNFTKNVNISVNLSNRNDLSFVASNDSLNIVEIIANEATNLTNTKASFWEDIPFEDKYFLETDESVSGPANVIFNGSTIPGVYKSNVLYQTKEWYDNYSYVLDDTENYIVLNQFLDTGLNEISIPSIALINGKEYKTVIDGQLFNNYSISASSGPMNITFEDGVIFHTMRNMFSNNDKVETITFGKVDTSQVSYFNNAFRNCVNLKNLDLSNLDTSNALYMDGMFSGCKNLESVNLSNFSTSKAVSLSNLFYNCINLKNLDLSSFNTSQVEDMSSMLRNLVSIKEIDISNFDTSNVAYMDYMLDSPFEKIILGEKFDTSVIDYRWPQTIFSSKLFSSIIVDVNANFENVIVPDDTFHLKGDESVENTLYNLLKPVLISGEYVKNAIDIIEQDPNLKWYEYYDYELTTITDYYGTLRPVILLKQYRGTTQDIVIPENEVLVDNQTYKVVLQSNAFVGTNIKSLAFCENFQQIRDELILNNIPELEKLDLSNINIYRVSLTSLPKLKIFITSKLLAQNIKIDDTFDIEEVYFNHPSTSINVKMPNNTTDVTSKIKKVSLEKDNVLESRSGNSSGKISNDHHIFKSMWKNTEDGRMVPGQFLLKYGTYSGNFEIVEGTSLDNFYIGNGLGINNLSGLNNDSYITAYCVQPQANKPVESIYAEFIPESDKSVLSSFATGKSNIPDVPQESVEFITVLEKVLYNSYPYDAIGLQERYKLSDEVFINICQEFFNMLIPEPGMLFYTPSPYISYNLYTQLQSLPQNTVKTNIFWELYKKVFANMPNIDDVEMMMYFPNDSSQILIALKYGQVKVLKTDELQNPLEGVEFSIYDSNGRLKTKIYTDKNGIAQTSGEVLLANLQYTIKETSSIEGYIPSNEVKTFRVKPDGITEVDIFGNVLSFENASKKGQVALTANKIHDRQLLGQDFSFVLKDSSGNILQTVHNDAQGLITFDALEFRATDIGTHEYTISEVKGDNKKIKYDEHLETVIIKVSDDGSDKLKCEVSTVNGNITFTNESIIDINLSKQDITTKEELPGATLQLKDKDGNLVEEWVSGTSSHKIEDILPGTYTLTEISAPDGYLIAESITFTVNKDGTVTGNTVMLDDYTKIKVVKVNKEGTRLNDAILQILDENKQVVATVTSNDDITGRLHIGKTYYVKEIQAPPRYVLSDEEKEFTVQETAEIQEIQFINEEMPPVKISKQDITTKEELPGATLVLKDSTGKEIERWVSTNTPHEVKGLSTGTYTLTEITAPSGYTIAESITFTVNADGTITGSTVMLDAPTKIRIIKRDSASFEILEGVEFEIKDEKGNVVDTFTSSTDWYVKEGLPAGKYFIHEVKALEGYIPLANDVEFVITDKLEDIDKEIIVYNDKPFSVSLSKQDITTKAELPGAKLQLKDESGNVIEEWTSSNLPHLIKNIKPGKYTLTEITAPEGYVKAESITFTVNADGTVTGSTVLYDDYTKLEILKVDENDVPLSGATLRLVNSENVLIKEWVSTNQAESFNKLPTGIYTLTEISVPAGYLKADDIKIEIKESAETVRVKMVDKKETPPETPPTPPEVPVGVTSAMLGASRETVLDNRRSVKVQTGDNNNIALYASLGAIFALLTAYSVKKLKEKNHEE